MSYRQFKKIKYPTFARADAVRKEVEAAGDVDLVKVRRRPDNTFDVVLYDEIKDD